MVKKSASFWKVAPRDEGGGGLHQKCKSCKMHRCCCCYCIPYTMHARLRKERVIVYTICSGHKKGANSSFVKRRSHTLAVHAPLRLRKQTIFDHCLLALQKRSWWGIFCFFLYSSWAFGFFYKSILDRKFKNAKSLTQFTFLGLFD